MTEFHTFCPICSAVFNAGKSENVENAKRNYDLQLSLAKNPYALRCLFKDACETGDLETAKRLWSINPNLWKLSNDINDKRSIMLTMNRAMTLGHDDVVLWLLSLKFLTQEIKRDCEGLYNQLRLAKCPKSATYLFYSNRFRN